MSARRVFLSQADVPEVPYDNKQEFMEKQRIFVAQYSALIHEVFNESYDVPSGPNRLVWTEKDMIIHGLYNFPQLQYRGTILIHNMTKGYGTGWCLVVSAWLADVISAGCRSHARALLTWPRNTPTLSDIYSRTLRQEMIASLFDSLCVFDQLYDACFVDMRAENSSILHTHTMSQWREIQLAFAMITHNRLTSFPLFETVDSYLVQHILSLTFISKNSGCADVAWW